MSHLLAMFDQVRVINLVDRTDRKREMTDQLDRVGGMAPNIAFYPAQRPSDPGEFPSLGARGCFESHLNVLRQAHESGAERLLIIEDDFDFTPSRLPQARNMLEDLRRHDWDFFYGSHRLERQRRTGLVEVPPNEPIVTAAFVGFHRRVLEPLVNFLEEIRSRPAGSPDYGPMHVDGAYAIFREVHPEIVCYAAFPPFGRQRSSPSDITPTGMLLDRSPLTQGIAAILRRVRNAIG